MHDFRLQKLEKFTYLIDDKVIDFWLSEKFSSMEGMRRKYNLIINLSKFIFNQKNIK